MDWGNGESVNDGELISTSEDCMKEPETAPVDRAIRNLSDNLSHCLQGFYVLYIQDA